MKERRHISPEQKMIVLRELFEGNSTISQLAEKYQIHPNDIFNWKKKLFESAPEIFSRKPGIKSNTATETKIKNLEEKLKKRDEAISFLVQETISLKKSTGGDN